jgi:hypothetical protein
MLSGMKLLIVARWVMLMRGMSSEVVEIRTSRRQIFTQVL